MHAAARQHTPAVRHPLCKNSGPAAAAAALHQCSGTPMQQRALQVHLVPRRSHQQAARSDTPGMLTPACRQALRPCEGCGAAPSAGGGHPGRAEAGTEGRQPVNARHFGKSCLQHWYHPQDRTPAGASGQCLVRVWGTAAKPFAVSSPSGQPHAVHMLWKTPLNPDHSATQGT